MENPLINILIRTTKGRENELQKCLDSIESQTYSNIKVIVCTDSPRHIVGMDTLYINFISQSLSVRNLRNVWLFDVQNTGTSFHWNFYCNNLKERVTDGWFFYLDDDDYLVHSHALAGIADHLRDPREGIICQFNRGSKAKPEFDLGDLVRANEKGILFNGKMFPTKAWGTFYVKPDSIIKGKIGGSCIFLHASQKDIANWDGKKAADYRFIKAVSEKIPLKWIPTVVVQAGNKGRRGK